MILHTRQLAFGMVALGLVCTPGPNMIYLLSRSISQGRVAGLVSLLGVIACFVFYMLCSVFGLTAMLIAVPFGYDALRFSGALYLLWLAWQAVRPGGGSPLEVRALTADTPSRLFTMGFLTNLLNPKAAVLYLSLLPQFINPREGRVLVQSLSLGTIQICVSTTVNTLIVLSAGSLAHFLKTRPTWLVVQRWLMGTVLGGLALRMATDARR